MIPCRRSTIFLIGAATGLRWDFDFDERHIRQVLRYSPVFLISKCS